MKKFKFFFHYNKLLSKQKGKPIISFHHHRTCYFVENLEINVLTKGEIRNKQPYFVIVGKANRIEIENNIARIY